MKVFGNLKSFFSSPFNAILLFGLLLAGAAAYLLVGDTDREPDGEKLSVYYFYMPACPDCAEQLPIYQAVQQEFPGLAYREYDITSLSGSAVFQQVMSRAGLDKFKMTVPAIVIGGRALVGLHFQEEIAAAISESLDNREAGAEFSPVKRKTTADLSRFEIPFLGRTDLSKFSLPALAVVLGLIDGFNPCAMWVLVYMIGLLIGINDRKKVWTVASSFVLASGVLYFLFMAAWINVFLLIGYLRLLTVAIGMVAIGGGIVNLKEYIATRGTPACKAVDDETAARTMTRIERIIARPLSVGVILSIIALAFIVNSVEFVCSAAIPAIFTQILALSGLSPLRYYLYIGLYTLFFMLDDLIIFGMAALAIGSSLGAKYAKACKLVGGVILTVLGLIILFAPHLLR